MNKSEKAVFVRRRTEWTVVSLTGLSHNFRVFCGCFDISLVYTSFCFLRFLG